MKRILFLLLFPLLTFGQHTIAGSFSPAKDYSFVFLYRSTPLQTEFVSRSEIDSIGRFTISLDSLSPKGIYKVIYATPPEKYNFNIIYNGQEDILLNFSEEKGLEFLESNENKLWASYTKSLEMINATISNFYSKGGEDKNAFKDIFKALSDFQKAYESNSENMLVHNLIMANRPYMPKDYENISSYAQHLKENYLKNVDFGNELLQSSDFISDRVMTFVFGISENTSDDFYEAQVGTLNDLVKNLDPTLQLSILLPVWQKFRLLSNDKMAMYMLDHNLMDLAQNGQQELLIETFTEFKNTIVGNKAPNFNINLPNKETSLYSLEGADKYLVIFWSSSCGHCLEEMPKIKTIISDYPNLQVIAYGLEDSEKNWAQEIKNYPSFIHVIGLDKWDNKDAIAYAIDSTPSFFLLDQDKLIIAKPDDAEALEILLKQD